MNARALSLSFCALGCALVLCVDSADASAPAGRYTTQLGTVTDTLTGLVWQQSVSSTTYTWANAKNYCSTLSLQGSGWRLPTLKEILTLVDYSAQNAPTIDGTAFAGTVCSPGCSYWSSTPDPGGTAAWDVDFSVALPYDDAATTPELVRCVR
jgi:hypothetical protein